MGAPLVGCITSRAGWPEGSQKLGPNYMPVTGVSMHRGGLTAVFVALFALVGAMLGPTTTFGSEWLSTQRPKKSVLLPVVSLRLSVRPHLAQARLGQYSSTQVSVSLFVVWRLGVGRGPGSVRLPLRDQRLSLLRSSPALLSGHVSPRLESPHSMCCRSDPYPIGHLVAR